MQNRKELVEKAINEFTQKNCSVLVKTDVPVLMGILKETLQNNNFNSIKTIIRLIGVIETNRQNRCFQNLPIYTLKAMQESYGNNTHSEELKSEEVFSVNLEDYYKSDNYKSITNLLDRKIDSSISQNLDEILLNLLNSDLFYDAKLYYYYDRLVEYFLIKKENKIVLEFIDSLGDPYDILYQIRPSFLYPCLKHAFSSNNPDFLNTIQEKIFEWFSIMDNEGIVAEDSSYLPNIIDLYIKKCDDKELLRRLIRVFISKDFSGKIMQMLITQSIDIRYNIVVNAIKKSLSSTYIKKFEYEFQIGNDELSINKRKESIFIQICKSIALYVASIEEAKMIVFLPLFEFLKKEIPKLNKYYIKRYSESLENFEKEHNRKERVIIDIEVQDSDELDKIKIIKKHYKQQRLILLNDMFNEVIGLLHAKHLNKGSIIIKIVRKLVEIELLSIKFFTNNNINLEIFPITYFKKSLQSKNNEVSDALFEELLSLLANKFNNSIYEDDQKYLSDLIDTLFENNRIDYVTRVLRCIIVTIKFESDKITKDNALYIILNLISNKIFGKNGDSPESIQLDKYVSILFNALNERENDEYYKENDLSELFAFEISSLNLRGVLGRVNVENINKLFPVIKLIRNSMAIIVTNEKLESEYKIKKSDNKEIKKEKGIKLKNALNANQFLDSSFHIASAYIKYPNITKEPTEYFGEDKWNLHKDIINKCYRQYQKKALTGKVADYLNFISRYLESSINTKNELINKKAKILFNIVEVLNIKFRAYIDAKKFEEVRTEEQKRMLSFLTHTLRNTLSAGPQIAKSISGNLKFLLGDSYLENNTAYKTINNATSLLTTFKYVDNLIDTFKLFSSDKSTITKKWEKETDGDLLIGNLINQTLIQTISKFLFYDSFLDERKQIFDSKNIKSVKESFLEQVLVNTENGNQENNVLTWLNKNSPIIQIVFSTSEFKIKNNGIRFGILFSIISELISNSFSYFDGIGKIEIDLNENEQFIEFTCQNHYDVNLNISKGTNKGIFFIKHIVGLVDELTLDIKQQDGVWISKIKIGK